MQSNREDNQELLKKAYTIKHFIGHSKCEVMYKRRENNKNTVLNKNTDFKEKREKEIADFKAFSDCLEIPPMME